MCPLIIPVGSTSNEISSVRKTASMSSLVDSLSALSRAVCGSHVKDGTQASSSVHSSSSVSCGHEEQSELFQVMSQMTFKLSRILETLFA